MLDGGLKDFRRRIYILYWRYMIDGMHNAQYQEASGQLTYIAKDEAISNNACRSSYHLAAKSSSTNLISNSQSTLHPTPPIQPK